MPKNVLTNCGCRAAVFGYLLSLIQGLSAALISIIFVSAVTSPVWSTEQVKPPWSLAGAQPIIVDADPITSFIVQDPRIYFGALAFRGGLALTSQNTMFGAFSGLALTNDGAHLLAVSDTGQWLSAAVIRAANVPKDLQNAHMMPIIGEDRQPLNKGKKWNADAEGLHLVQRAGAAIALISFERQLGKLRSADLSHEGLNATALIMDESTSLNAIRGNQGIEAIVMPPQGSPLEGWLLVFGEKILRGGHHSAWALKGRRAIRFSIERRDNFDITAADFLPNGDLLLLERRFSLTEGSAVRLRRLSRYDLTVETFSRGGLLDGMDLMTADLSHQIDNMEGMSIWQRADGTPVITLISDDNFNFFQRTLLLEFELRPEEFGVVPKVRPANTM